MTGIALEVRVSPGASRNKVLGLYKDDIVKIAIKSPPVDGKANETLVYFLSELFSVAKKNVVIVRGESSRTKRIFIQGDKDKLQQVLQKILNP